MAPSFSSLKTVVLSLSALWSLSRSECADETRIRKPWHSLSEKEQMIYVTGFQKLSELETGGLDMFIKSHQKATGQDEFNIHKSAQNLYWHSYWLYEMETAIRALGPEYECFTLPYWDVTVDGKYWNTAENPKIEDIPIYSGMLGGEGDIDNDMCVGEPWTLDSYNARSLCADDEVEGFCCLKRLHMDIDNLGRPTVLYMPEDVGKLVYTDFTYRDFDNFLGQISGMHGDVHSFFGSATGTHFDGDGTGAPTSEPLFPVFHSFIDYLRLLHHDCNQWDLVDSAHLDKEQPYVYNPVYKGANVPLDYAMDFSYVCDQDWSICSRMDITPRMMMDVSPNSQFGVIYELGDFWTGQHKLKTMCFDKLNVDWWTIRGKQMPNAAAVAVKHDSAEEFVADHASHSVKQFGSVTAATVIFMAIVVALVAMLKFCGSPMRKKALMSEQAEIYGAV